LVPRKDGNAIARATPSAAGTGRNSAAKKGLVEHQKGGYSNSKYLDLIRLKSRQKVTQGKRRGIGGNVRKVEKEKRVKHHHLLSRRTKDEKRDESSGHEPKLDQGITPFSGEVIQKDKRGEKRRGCDGKSRESYGNQKL